MSKKRIVLEGEGEQVVDILPGFSIEVTHINGKTEVSWNMRDAAKLIKHMLSKYKEGLELAISKNKEIRKEIEEDLNQILNISCVVVPQNMQDAEKKRRGELSNHRLWLILNHKSAEEEQEHLQEFLSELSRTLEDIVTGSERMYNDIFTFTDKCLDKIAKELDK